MTEMCYGFLLIEEMSDNSHEVGVVANVLGSPPSWDHQRDVVARINVRKTQIGIPCVTRLFCVGLKTRLEVMYHKAQLLLLRSGNIHLIAFFLQPLVWIHHLKRLSSVARLRTFVFGIEASPFFNDLKLSAPVWPQKEGIDSRTIWQSQSLPSPNPAR